MSDPKPQWALVRVIPPEHGFHYDEHSIDLDDVLSFLLGKFNEQLALTEEDETFKFAVIQLPDVTEADGHATVNYHITLDEEDDD